MAKPTLALIPASQGSKVFSVLPSSGVGDFDFSRGSAATRINSQGLIENVVSGQSRLEYPLIDGVVNGCPSLLLEPQRTNLVTYSEDFSNAYWTKGGSSIVINNAISPDGSLNADKLVEDTSTGGHFLYKQLTTTALSTYTASVFAKVGENDFIILQDPFSSGNPRQWFDLNNGILGTGTNISNASIIPFGNGFYKCTVTWVISSTNGGLGINTSKLDNSTSYTGDGTSGVYIYGAQLEEASYPTSYIPTNGTTVTRLAETANGAGDATTFNDSEGVLMVEISALDNDLTLRQISLSDGTLSNQLVIYYGNGSNKIFYYLSVGGVAQVNDSVIISDIVSFNKIAFKYKQNDFALWINGVNLLSDSSGNTYSASTLSELNLTNGQGSGDYFYGKTKQIQYFQTALTDSELEQLTSWISFTDMANGQLYTIE